MFPLSLRLKVKITIKFPKTLYKCVHLNTGQNTDISGKENIENQGETEWNPGFLLRFILLHIFQVIGKLNQAFQHTYKHRDMERKETRGVCGRERLPPLVSYKTQIQAVIPSKRYKTDRVQSDEVETAMSKVHLNQQMGKTSILMSQSTGMKLLLQTSNHPWVGCNRE